ncbi:S41 family peptidase [Candidatus Uabimicrobium sp. HlEnr_7]|uniref:S41 family peptidase n=1 Tax=Candidatus Uabimicrobium helgolandensis TaxID=3095367 RepID=UPI0035572AF0
MKFLLNLIFISMVGIFCQESDFSYISKRFEYPNENKWAKRWLPRAQAVEDLKEFQQYLESKFSYLLLREVNYQKALEVISSNIGEGIEVGNLALQINKILALFPDGHAAIRGARKVFPNKLFTPFLFGEHNRRIFIFMENRESFFHQKFLYIKEMDGIKIEKWLEVSKQSVVKGSPQLMRKRAMKNLRYIGILRKELGVKNTNELELVLESRQAETFKTKVKLSSKKAYYGKWPRTKTKLIGNIGYLRIPSMSDEIEDIEKIYTAMDQFRTTRGLIIDVRGNSGGSRDILKVLFAYFMSPGEKPQIVNVAKYRKSPHEIEDGYLQSRFLYPENSAIWSKEEREVIAQFKTSFIPEWNPPVQDFSQWHYFILKHSGNKSVYYYSQPIVVLINSNCFSATDIFLGALKRRKNIKIIGTPSSGGSGRSKTFRLENSGIGFKISRMASFQANGKLYDCNGIFPDILVYSQPEFELGTSDVVLEKALEKLKTNTKTK